LGLAETTKREEMKYLGQHNPHGFTTPHSIFRQMIKKSFIAIFVLFPLAAVADTLYLNDGSTISGKIKEVRANDIVITTTIGEMTIASSKISRVDWTDATRTPLPSPEGVQSAEAAAPKTFSDWRKQQKNGLGFGLGISSVPGITLFYDHNLSGKNQLHFQIDSNASSRSNLLGEELLKSRRGRILTTYRFFPVGGLYLGLGGGYANSTLEYNASSLATPYQYTSNINGLFLIGEIGWQGKDGYYFHVGIQPAGYISSSDNYNENKIPNTSNHRSTANQEHRNLKNLSQLSLGFGWFF
jgi:hypothetical protein